MVKIDTHVHTKEGSIDCRVSIHDTIDILKSKGYNAVLITDHNSYKGYEVWLESGRVDFVVLCGVEYDTIDAGHIIVILPTGVRLSILEHRGLYLKELSNLVHTYGGILGPAHPYGYGKLGVGNRVKGEYSREVIDSFDFIEIYNSCIDDESNKKANQLAKRYKKVSLAGSDSHRLGCIGLSYSLIDYGVENESDLIAAIKMGKVKESTGINYDKALNNNLMWYRVLVYCFYIIHLLICKIQRKRLNRLKGEVI